MARWASTDPWDVKRILGTVPVEADGSAHFKIPANSPLALQPLDEKGQALQLMRSWFVGMPGEAISCAGCHEPRNEVSLNRPALASRRPPSRSNRGMGRPAASVSCAKSSRFWTNTA